MDRVIKSSIKVGSVWKEYWTFNYNIVTETTTDPETGESITNEVGSDNIYRIGSDFTLGDIIDEIVDGGKTISGSDVIAFYDLLKEKGIDTDNSVLLSATKKAMIANINAYDVSPAVNSFSYGGVEMWLDKAMRVGLMNAATIQKSAGIENSVLWFNSMKIEIPVDTMISLLGSLEIYALGCYNKTQEHIKFIEDGTNAVTLALYDYTEGYPDRLVI